MKIQSSTQWSNLYSIESKYNINIRYSYYKLAAYSFIAILACLITLVIFTFHYTVALWIAIITTLAFSLFLSLRKAKKTIIGSFILTKAGEVVLNNEQISYQLLPESRLSFIGCWLVLLPNQNAVTECSYSEKKYPKQFFIFKDSLHEQDFSRLARVINQLN